MVRRSRCGRRGHAIARRSYDRGRWRPAVLLGQAAARRRFDSPDRRLLRRACSRRRDLGWQGARGLRLDECGGGDRFRLAPGGFLGLAPGGFLGLAPGGFLGLAARGMAAGGLLGVAAGGLLGLALGGFLGLAGRGVRGFALGGLLGLAAGGLLG